MHIRKWILGGGGLIGYIGTWKEVVLNSPGFFQNMPREGGYSDPIKFAGISFAIYGLFTMAFNRSMFPFQGELTSFMVPASLIITSIAGTISLFIEAAILYYMFKSLGGNGTYEGTVRIAAYATAVLLLAWIPYIGIIFGLYSVYLYGIGSTFVHNIILEKSSLFILMPAIMIFVITTPLVALYAGMEILS